MALRMNDAKLLRAYLAECSVRGDADLLMCDHCDRVAAEEARQERTPDADAILTDGVLFLCELCLEDHDRHAARVEVEHAAEDNADREYDRRVDAQILGSESDA